MQTEVELTALWQGVNIIKKSFTTVVYCWLMRASVFFCLISVDVANVFWMKPLFTHSRFLTSHALSTNHIMCAGWLHVDSFLCHQLLKLGSSKMLLFLPTNLYTASFSLCFIYDNNHAISLSRLCTFPYSLLLHFPPLFDLAGLSCTLTFYLHPAIITIPLPGSSHISLSMPLHFPLL